MPTSREPGVAEVAAAVDETSDETLSENLALLSDERRVAIVRELAAAGAVPGSPVTISFSELLERVGIRDSGQFNYHLGRLRGRFVDRTDEGYRLTPTGAALGETILGSVEDHDRYT